MTASLVSLRCRTRDAAVCGTAVLAACLLVHARALDGFFLADDYTIIGSFWGKDARYLVGLLASDEIGGVWEEQFVRPVRPWSLAVDGRVWGLEPLGFHLTNLLLHAGASTLLGIVVLRLGGDLLAAVLASLLFLLHPLNVEVATWITARDESLCGAALLGAVGCHLEAGGAKRKRLLLALACSLFVLSLFAKEYGLLLPFALWTWALVSPPNGLRRRRALAGAVRASLPYLGIIAAFLGLRWIVTGQPLGGYGARGGAHVTLGLDLLIEAVASFAQDLSHSFLARPLAGGIVLLGALLQLVMSGRTAMKRKGALVGYWALFWPLLFLMPTHNLVYSPRHLYISFAGVAVAFGLVLARGRGPLKHGLELLIGVFLVALLAPPTLEREEDFARMSSRCRTVLSSIERYAKGMPTGDVLVLVGMPAHETPPWGFGWSLEDALRPPFLSEALDSRLQVIRRRQWRPEAWAAIREKHPGRRVHVLVWNPDLGGVEFIRDDGLAPGGPEAQKEVEASRGRAR